MRGCFVASRRARVGLGALALLIVSGNALAQARAVAVDGDSLLVDGRRVRIMGLDAPEMRGRCPREQQLARMARDRMAELIAGGVRIQPHGNDRYGRLLAVVYDARGRDVAAVLIREGLARPYGGRGRREGWC